MFNREFGADAKSHRELAREGYEIDGQRYSLIFKVVPKVAVDIATRRLNSSMSSLSAVASSVIAALYVRQIAGYADAWTSVNNKLVIRRGDTGCLRRISGVTG